MDRQRMSLYPLQYKAGAVDEQIPFISTYLGLFSTAYQHVYVQVYTRESRVGESVVCVRVCQCLLTLCCRRLHMDSLCAGADCGFVYVVFSTGCQFMAPLSAC